MGVALVGGSERGGRPGPAGALDAGFVGDFRIEVGKRI